MPGSSERRQPRSDSERPAIGVLAIQGSFQLHLRALEELGVAARKVRLPGDLEELQGLILPGGESTVMSGVARESGLLDELRASLEGGLPVFGTCAGAILLGQGREDPERLGLVPLVVDRNAYGRQYESFERVLHLRPFEAPFQCIFIRAPKIRLAGGNGTPVARSPGTRADRRLEILGCDGEDPVLVRYGSILLATFHPELTADLRIHRYFIENLVGGQIG